ncbi:hypothetical protein AC1031_011974 [Aphanomyces cochlioides]|nr:hypothetical protein AC1031_011974 [Aphanomyces cochlioides]
MREDCVHTVETRQDAWRHSLKRVKHIVLTPQSQASINETGHIKMLQDTGQPQASLSASCYSISLISSRAEPSRRCRQTPPRLPLARGSILMRSTSARARQSNEK